MPRLTDEQSRLLEVLTLDGLIHIDGMGLHLTQLQQLLLMVDEHPTHDFCQYLLGRAGDAGIVEQMTLRIFGLGEHIVGQPTHTGILVEATLGVQQLHTT